MMKNWVEEERKEKRTSEERDEISSLSCRRVFPEAQYGNTKDTRTATSRVVLWKGSGQSEEKEENNNDDDDDEAPTHAHHGIFGPPHIVSFIR